jgi:hypothetical protein
LARIISIFFIGRADEKTVGIQRRIGLYGLFRFVRFALAYAGAAERYQPPVSVS